MSASSVGRFRFATELTSTVWPYRPLSAPLYFVMSLYAVAGLLRVADKWIAPIPLALVWVPPIFVAAAVVFYFACTVTDVLVFAYAALVAFSSAGWLIWTMFTSPYTVTSAVAALVGLCVLGLFFGPTRRRAHDVQVWAEERAAARERREEQEQDDRDPWEIILEHSGYKGMKVIAKDPTRAGYTVRCHLPSPATFDWATISGNTAVLEANADHILDEEITAGAITVFGGSKAKEANFIVDTENILAQTVPFDMTDYGPQDICEAKSFGLLKDGRDIEIDVTSGHGMVIAASGGGKSGFANVLTAHTTSCSNATMWISACDKGLSIAGPWMKPWLDGKPGSRGRPPIWAAITEEESVNQLLLFYQLVDIRQESPRGGADKLTPSNRRPQLVYLVEEAPTLMASTVQYKTHRENEFLTPSELVLRCLRLSRSEAGRIYLISQRGTVTFLGPNGGDVKSLFDIKIGMRTNSQVDTVSIFDHAPKNMDLTKLKNPGSLWVQMFNSPTLPGRTAWLDPIEDVPVLAKRHMRWVPEFEPNVVKAWGTLYSERFSVERFGEVERKLRSFLADEEENFNEDFVGASQVAAAPAAGSVATENTDGMAAMDRPVDARLAPPELPQAYKDALEKKRREEGEDLDPQMIEEYFGSVEAFLAENVPVGDTAISDAYSQVSDSRRRKMLRFIDQAGTACRTPKEIQDYLEAEGNPPNRVTVQKWLSEGVEAGDLVKPEYGRYAARRHYQ